MESLLPNYVPGQARQQLIKWFCCSVGLFIGGLFLLVALADLPIDGADVSVSEVNADVARLRARWTLKGSAGSPKGLIAAAVYGSPRLALL